MPVPAFIICVHPRSSAVKITPFVFDRNRTGRCSRILHTRYCILARMPNFLENLKQIVNRHEPDPDEHALPRAAAVLLLEMAAADAGIDERERRVIERAVTQRFGLGEDELRELLAEAGRRQRDTHSLHEFTHQLRTSLDPGTRGELVEWLWRVAYADDHVDRHEEHLVRRLADLLGVPHREFIRRKHRASALNR
jgi:uncharacterized tellurite resistance protein B-like protein